MKRPQFDLEHDFIDRHNGPRQHQIPEMLKTIGVADMDQLMDETIPSQIRHENALDLPQPLSEFDYLNRIRQIAKKNDIYKSYIGMGYHPVILPSVILRNVLENPGWYTQYTPYQAEISQGRLEMLLNFQTLVSDLTGMPVANASLLDEATAAAEAMTLAARVKPKSKKQSETIILSENLHPQTIDVIETRANPLDIQVKVVADDAIEFTDDVYAVIVGYPDTNGDVKDFRSMIESAHKNDVQVIFVVDLLSLTLLASPGELGADIVVGSAQRFGVPMGYGGPHAAFLATTEENKRQIPGRIIGVSIDSQGNPAYRMALQTREQHIRRDKATSNICTAQALLANMAAMYAIYHGPEGIKAIAEYIHGLTSLFAEHVKKAGYTVSNEIFFDTIRITGLDRLRVDRIQEAMSAKRINLRYFADGFSVSFHEQAKIADVAELIKVLSDISGQDVDFNGDHMEFRIPSELERKTDFLTHPTFHLYRSETEMMRYLKRLENKDLSLTTSMIPLGSCTMKLNAATEMIPVTMAEFSEIHPFAPVEQAAGYHQMFTELSDMLKEITQFPGVSLQPNAGAQGEYAGLLVIRKYLEAKGEGHRNIALIPTSAHGTNPASAVMAGMKVVVVKADEHGNIDIDDLRSKAEKHADNLAALMVTYPSTHGVFEAEIKTITKIIHDHGGQVYMDGANMNAQVGLTSPGSIGADVCHLNLHKTFCIPHGGGGPGMGPICVAEHLIPFLPSHPVIPVHISDKELGTISAAPYGSASILLISHAYISMTGDAGLTDATKMAILNANYIKSKLEDDYTILYAGENGRVAHELIFDCREFKKTAGIEVEDLAKRLMDYGFHAPTMSFPVAGTMMVEPTESESMEELDRFISAMKGIREEIRQVESAQLPQDDNPLVNAPHTMEMVIADAWTHAYSREVAAFPMDSLRAYKYWPTVARIDNAHGDRELICTCPPIEAYED